jgi:DNA (cytosine-5)-methyltransferase 1
VSPESRQLSLGESSGPASSVANVSQAASIAGGPAVSLFTGAGGLDIGCEAGGFSTRAVVEVDEVARQTLIENRDRHFPDLRDSAIFADIVNLNYEELLSAAGLEVQETALLHGGPPCTPFSKSGYWLEYKRAGNDPKASLLDHYVRALQKFQPKAFLMENVYGLAYSNHNRPVLERFLTGVRRAGYAHDKKVVLAADHGVPQLRQRFFVIGVRADLLDCAQDIWRFDWPTATHDGPHERRVERDRELPPHVSAREAFRGLSRQNNPREPEELVDGTYADALREVPPGDNYLHLTAKRGHPDPQFEWRRRYWSFLLKLHPDRPSPTIQGQPGPWVGPFHWDNRRLRVAELKRLMTFPDDFVVCGNRRQQQLQLGNAVPSLLGERIARQIGAELARLGAAEPLAAAA